MNEMNATRNSTKTDWPRRRRIISSIAPNVDWAPTATARAQSLLGHRDSLADPIEIDQVRRDESVEGQELEVRLVFGLDSEINVVFHAPVQNLVMDRQIHLLSLDGRPDFADRGITCRQIGL